MSEPASGASAILNPEPPATPEAAAARIAQMDASPEFQTRVKSGDTKAFQERAELWRVAHGMPAKPVAPVNEADVFGQMEGRALAEFTVRAEGMRNDGMDELSIYEF